MEPAAPHGLTVPSFSLSTSAKAGIAPYSPEYPLGPKHAANPHEFSPNVLNLSLCLIQYVLLAMVAFFEFMLIFFALRHFPKSILHLVYQGVLFGVVIFYFITLNRYHKRTERGAEVYSMWLAHRRFLKDFGRFSEKELPEVSLWERYLVTATVFRLAKRVQKKMELQMTSLEDSTYLTSYALINYNLSRSITRSVSSSYSSARSTISSHSSGSSYSSGGGFGGGSSFGGGSGGGGGGGGRF